MGKYDSIISAIFAEKYVPGDTQIIFERELLNKKATSLGIVAPKNLGDIIYSYKYRHDLPRKIIETAPTGSYWRIKNIGRSQYAFVLTQGIEYIEPDKMLKKTKIPNATPSIVKKYSISDEQALLAIVRYNRLIDIFLGITCYSLQNHLRTTVKGIGQIETDEIYIGINKSGKQFIIPVQAKGGNDKLGIAQIEQDIALCKEKYPELTCCPIACQFLSDDIVVMFELTVQDELIVKNNEKHYKIVEASEISKNDLKEYTKII